MIIYKLIVIVLLLVSLQKKNKKIFVCILNYILSLFLSLLVLRFLRNIYRCRWLFLHLMIISNIHTLGETPLEKESAFRRDLFYLHNTQL